MTTVATLKRKRAVDDAGSKDGEDRQLLPFRAAPNAQRDRTSHLAHISDDSNVKADDMVEPSMYAVCAKSLISLKKHRSEPVPHDTIVATQQLSSPHGPTGVQRSTRHQRTVSLPHPQKPPKVITSTSTSTPLTTAIKKTRKTTLPSPARSLSMTTTTTIATTPTIPPRLLIPELTNVTVDVDAEPQYAETDIVRPAPLVIPEKKKIQRSLLEPPELSQQEPIPLNVGDHILFQYMVVLLEGVVESKTEEFVMVCVPRSNHPFIEYPWGLRDPMESNAKERFRERRSRGYIDVQQYTVIVRLPVKSRTVLAISRFVMDRETCVNRRHVASALSAFRDFHLSLGDHVEMMVQGSKISEPIEEQTDASEKCPFVTRAATVTKENANLVRLQFLPKRDKIVEWIDKTSLLCWRRTKRAQFFRHNGTAWNFKLAKDGPINPLTGQIEPL